MKKLLILSLLFCNIILGRTLVIKNASPHPVTITVNKMEDSNHKHLVMPWKDDSIDAFATPITHISCDHNGNRFYDIEIDNYRDPLAWAGWSTLTITEGPKATLKL